MEFSLIRPLLLISTFTATISTANAQTSVSVGPRIGANLSAVSYKGSANNVMGSFNSTYKVGGEAGLMATINWEHFALQPAILYAQQRYGLSDDHVEDHGVILHYVSQSDYRLNYLTLPINMAYCLRSDGQGLQGFLGGYVSYLLGGNVNGSGYYDITNGNGSPRFTYTIDQDIKAGNEFDRTTNIFYSKRYGIGAQAGVGYRLDRFLFQAAYSVGLSNVGASYGDANSSPSYYNRSAQIYIVYNVFTHK